MDSKPTMSSEEAAKILPYSVEHINLLCRQRKIRAKKPFGRWILDANHVKELAGFEEHEEIKTAEEKVEVKEASGEINGKEQQKGTDLDI